MAFFRTINFFIAYNSSGTFSYSSGSVLFHSKVSLIFTLNASDDCDSP